MRSRDGERSAFRDLIAPGLFLLAGFVVAGIGWVYLAIEQGFVKVRVTVRDRQGRA
jgi:hypothetical protein